MEKLQVKMESFKGETLICLGGILEVRTGLAT